MPSADVLGVIIGILFIIPTIYFIRTKDWDRVAWPFFLITLPVYYMLFGVLAMDGTAILNEFLYGLPFIITGLLAWRMRSKAALLVVALAWLSHGFYDIYKANTDGSSIVKVLDNASQVSTVYYLDQNYVDRLMSKVPQE